MASHVSTMKATAQRYHDQISDDMEARSARGTLEDLPGLSEIAEDIQTFAGMVEFFDRFLRHRELFRAPYLEATRLDAAAAAEADAQRLRDKAEKLNDAAAVRDVREAFPGSEISHINGRPVPAEAAA